MTLVGCDQPLQTGPSPEREELCAAMLRVCCFANCVPKRLPVNTRCQIALNFRN